MNDDENFFNYISQIFQPLVGSNVQVYESWNHYLYSPHQFKTNAQVIPKIEVIEHVDDVVWAVCIAFP